MILENKNIGIIFLENFYIKDDLLSELNKMSKNNHINIIPIFESEEGEENKINIYKIGSILKNKKILCLNDELEDSYTKLFDILILVGFRQELLYELNNQIFDTPVLRLIKLFEKEKIPIVLGLKCNTDIFVIFEQIKRLFNKNKYYFIPMIFPNPITKPELITFDPFMILRTIEYALEKIQIKPIISSNYIS